MKKTKKVIDIEARTGKTIQELLFLCVERDYTLNKAAKYIGVRDSKTVITLINRFAPILSDHKFRHGNEVSGKKRIAHMRAMNAASNKKKCILISGFFMTRKEHCKRLNVKYTTFLSRKRAGLSDIEALGIDMTWKTHEGLAYEQRHSEKIIELNAKGLPAKTISYRYGIPLKTTYRVLSKLKDDIEGSGFIDAHEVKKIIGVCESALRGRINNHENFPSCTRVGRKRYWKREDIENYANNC